MQIVSNRDNLHEMSNPYFLGKIRKKISSSLSSAELAQRVVKVKNHQTVYVMKSNDADKYQIVLCDSEFWDQGSISLNPASILRKSTSGRHRPVSYPDGPMTARYRFT